MTLVNLKRMPTRWQLGKLAEERPHVLNVLVAFFCFEWRGIFTGAPLHGLDQLGEARKVPNYVSRWGLDATIHYLLRAPQRRDPEGPGLLSEIFNGDQDDDHPPQMPGVSQHPDRDS